MPSDVEHFAPACDVVRSEGIHPYSEVQLLQQQSAAPGAAGDGVRQKHTPKTEAHRNQIGCKGSKHLTAAGDA